MRNGASGGTVLKAILTLSGLLASAVSGAPEQETGPGPRHGHELVYDEARDRTILFGGFGNDGMPRQDTWTWNGIEWQLAAVDGPPPRKWPAAAYDARRGLIVLHGGREGPGRTGRSLGDTWIWDGSRWSEFEGTGPPGRDHHRAVYDKRRDRVVLFGGWNGERHLDDTWEWNGSRWTPVATGGPSPRAAFGMAYHEKRNEVLLVGGQDLDQAYADMWRWTESTWSRLEEEAPGARGFHAMSYDPNNAAILLFGGRNGDVLLNDLWSWADTRWVRVHSSGPLLRGVFGSAFDRRRSQLVIHGSGQRENDEWRLDSRTWAWRAGVGWRTVAGAESREGDGARARWGGSPAE